MVRFGIPGQNTDPLAYGDSRLASIPVVQAPRRPTTTDKRYPMWCEWRVNKNATAPAVEGEFWKLVRFESNGDATWQMFSSGTSGGVVSFVTDDGAPAVEPDGLGVVNILGGSGIDVTGTGPGNTVTIALSGGGTAIDQVNVDFSSGSGTDPVVPTGTGEISILGNAVANGTNANAPVASHSRAANQFHIDVQLSTAISTPADPFDCGICSFNNSFFQVDPNGHVTPTGTGIGQTITGDSGGALSPTAGNWDILGLGETSTSGSGSTLSILSPRTAKWVVDPTGNNGTHTTIASALSAASTGETVLIRPGTYVEDPTLKAGVNLVAYPGDEETPNVTIQGTCTATFAGTCTISGIRLQTNSAALLAVTGSSATVVNLENCHLDCTDNSGITFSSSSSSAAINIYRCTGDLGTTGINFFAHSSAGFLQIFHSRITNTGASTTASTVSAGTFQSDFNALFFPITNSSTSVSVVQFTEINTNSINTTSFTNNSTDSNNTFRSCHLVSGTASPLSVGAGAVVNVHMSTFDHTNATTIAGSGTVRYSDISKAGANANFAIGGSITQTKRNTFTGGLSFDGGTNVLNIYEEGTWTPTVADSGGGMTGQSYTVQNGQYTRIGNIVMVYCQVSYTASGAGSGSLVVDGLPYTIENISNYNPRGACALQNIAFPASTSFVVVTGNPNTTNVVFQASRDNSTIVTVGTDTGGDIVFNLTYQV